MALVTIKTKKLAIKYKRFKNFGKIMQTTLYGKIKVL
jgi:hypothetical protein